MARDGPSLEPQTKTKKNFKPSGTLQFVFAQWGQGALLRWTHEIAPAGCSYDLGVLYWLGDSSTQANNWPPPSKPRGSCTWCFATFCCISVSSSGMQSTMSTSPISVCVWDNAIAILSRLWVLKALSSHDLWPSTTSCANGDLMHSAVFGRLPSMLEQTCLHTYPANLFWYKVLSVV